MKARSRQKIVQGFRELSQNLLEGIVCVFLIAALANMPVLAHVYVDLQTHREISVR